MGDLIVRLAAKETMQVNQQLMAMEGQGSIGGFSRIGSRRRRALQDLSVVGTISRWCHWRFLAMVLIVGMGWAQAARAGEFRFEAKDLPDSSVVWLPEEVVLHRERDLEGGLVFVLVNLTARTHVFLVEGLYEQIVGEQGDIATKPFRVTLASGETIRAIVSTARLEAHQPPGAVEEFRFLCPLHPRDGGSGGRLRMVHRGGTIRSVR